MDLLDLLQKSGGGDSIGQIASAVGLDSSDASKLVASLAPALMGSLSKNVSGGGLAGLQQALEKGSHDRYIDNPQMMRDDSTRQDGNKILGHILGSKDASRAVASAAEKDTGIDVSLIKKALPLLATLAMGAMAKNNASSQSSGLGGLLDMAKKFL
jgi:hypothetical protein